MRGIAATSVTAFVIGAMVAASGCDDGDNNSNNGSMTATIDGTTRTFAEVPEGFYVSGSNFSAAGANESGSIRCLTVNFPGQTTGTFTGPLASVTYYDETATSYSSMNAGGNCTVTVTSYGAVGERIEGTFSGMITAGGSTSYPVTGGTFSVTRTADL